MRPFGLTMEHFEESNQDNSADQSDHKTTEVEAIDCATDTEKAEDPAPEDGTYDTDDNIEKNTLLSIGAHEHRGDPADQTSENDIDEKAHKGVVKNLVFIDPDDQASRRPPGWRRSCPSRAS